MVAMTKVKVRQMQATTSCREGVCMMTLVEKKTQTPSKTLFKSHNIIDLNSDLILIQEKFVKKADSLN